MGDASERLVNCLTVDARYFLPLLDSNKSLFSHHIPDNHNGILLCSLKINKSYPVKKLVQMPN